jgi:hypothetical protein
VKLRKLTWKGRSRKAPDKPAIDVKIEMKKATSGGTIIEVSTWETGNLTARKSIRPPDQWKSWHTNLCSGTSKCPPTDVERAFWVRLLP